VFESVQPRPEMSGSEQTTVLRWAMKPVLRERLERATVVKPLTQQNDMLRAGPTMSHHKFPCSAAQVPLRVERVLDPIDSLAVGYEGLRLPAAVLLDNVRSMYNVGAFFRVADGVRLEKVCLCGITAHPPKKAISKTALGAEEVVPWEHSWDAIKTAEGLRGRGFAIAAIETSSHSVDLFEWQPDFPVCVAFGNEVEGLKQELLEMADTHVRIPMLGKKTSLNVATAAGIVLYELLRKYRILGINSK
jgi:23S rRNA (guanosine2251-2'-O)-methyltransferase